MGREDMPTSSGRSGHSHWKVLAACIKQCRGFLSHLKMDKLSVIWLRAPQKKDQLTGDSVSGKSVQVTVSFVKLLSGTLSIEKSPS